MIQELYPSIHLLEIPLPDNPLRAINCYMIKGSERNLVIDTGFDIAEGRRTLSDAMDRLGFDPGQTDLLITHLHSDHSGLAAHLAGEGMLVYAGRVDGLLINEMAHREYWEKFDRLSILMGLAEDRIDFEDHPGFKYCPKAPVDFQLLDEGDVLSVGDYHFRVVDVPGHTPGHIALYEPEHRLFFGGDHVLDRISPNIGFWGFEQDILAVYLNNLDKVRSMEIDWLFTAHRNILRDPERRIDQLKEHHRNRLAEILEILTFGPQTVRQVASRMHWDLRISDWEQFPNNQKWFASGEALSHLEHLVACETVGKMEREGVLYYHLNPK